MARLVIFKAAWPELRKADLQPTFPGGGSSDILSQRLDYSDGAPPRVGDRTLEFKDAGHLEPSSSRLSPWRVARVEEYVGNTGLESMDEVVVAHCEYSPLPEEENPWTQSTMGQITVENFGGDTEAFTHWRESQRVTA